MPHRELSHNVRFWPVDNAAPAPYRLGRLSQNDKRCPIIDGFGEEIAWVDTDDTDFKTAKATAKLLRTAPELLEALKKMVAGPTTPNNIALAQRAILKASGFPTKMLKRI